MMKVRSGGKNRSNKVRAIETHFGDTFENIVKGMVADGHTKYSMAKAFQTDRKHLKKMLRWNDLLGEFDAKT